MPPSKNKLNRNGLKLAAQSSSPYPTIPIQNRRLCLLKKVDSVFTRKAMTTIIGLKIDSIQLFPSCKSSILKSFFLAMTDSTPILERDLAYRAGLGWVGKNTCLIHPKKGSLFFLGEIITSLNIESPLTPVHDFCGTCTRCMDICPTQALISPRKMDARKCIAYLTIESRDIPPEELRKPIGDWLFGCDLCQTVCPWNQKVFKNELETQELLSLSSEEEKLQVEDLRYLLTSSGKKLEKDFFGTAYSRAGSFGLKRNALIVAANRNLKELTPEIEALSTHPKLGPLAEWALTQLKS